MRLSDMERISAPTYRLAPKASEIAAKVIDGEAIIINLTNGYYYSMQGVGAAIWEAIQQQGSLNALALTLSRRYDVSQEAASGDIDSVVKQLMHEGLVTLLDVEGPQTTPLEEPDSETKLPYTPPSLQKYGDMAHFFAVDPPLPDLSESILGDNPA
jgi:hypothetical protein